MKHPVVLGVSVVSSADPSKYSATFKGIAILVLPTILLVLSAFGVQLPQVEAMEVVNQIAGLITLVGGVIGGVITLFGSVRKIANYFKKK